MLLLRPLIGTLLLTIALVRLPAQETVATAASDAEETFELRMEQVLQKGGHRALYDRLQKEQAARPRGYVKAWVANYLIYGAAFGLPEVADPVRGFAMAKESRAEGSVFGAELVGRALGNGRGCEKNPGEAAKLLREAANAGRGSAMSELAKYYFFGLGLPENRSLGEHWARLAAWRGSLDGLPNLATWWIDARYTSTPDVERGLQLAYEAAEHGAPKGFEILNTFAASGNPTALKYQKLQYVVGAIEGAVARPAQLKATIKWLEENTKADDVPVQLAIARLRMERLSPVFDPEKARQRLQLLASTSDDAGALLADMKFRGIGQRADQAGAIADWKELVKRGNARALNALGWYSWFENATRYGLPKDAKAAFTYFSAAAESGYYEAQFNLAACYADGVGTPQNYAQAAKYYGMLARRGYLRAIEKRDRVLALAKD
jgi:TPR repeat protein